MKPLNRDEPGCNFTSSNCVIWQGPDIPCIKLCKGDSVSDVVYKLATELCTVLDTLDINKYEISCLNLPGCAPANFHDFLQSLINLICQLQDCCNNSTPGSPSTQDSFLTQQMPINPMYYYTDQFGNQITTMTGRQYLTTVGNVTATIQVQLDSVTTTVATHSDQIQRLQTDVQAIPTPDQTLIVPVCVAPSVPTVPNQVLIELEKQFCLLQSATGQPALIYAAIQQQCANLANQNTLSNSGQTYGSLAGWNSDVFNLANSINNQWLFLCDIAAAIRNIQANCCPTACSGITLSLITELSGTNLILNISGTIPSGFANCPQAFNVTITDTSGGSITRYVDVVANLNIPGGFIIALSATPIDITNNLNTHIDVCLSNSSTSASCSSVLDYLLVNTPACPTLVYTPSTNSIQYNGVSLTGTYSYDVQLWNSAGTVMIANQIQVRTGPASIAGTFAGLIPNSSFKVRVVVSDTLGVNTTSCPFESVVLASSSILPVSLGTTVPFVVLGGAGITETSGSGGAFIGNVGSAPTVTITGILPANVTGTLYTGPSPIVTAAKVDVTGAIADAASRTPFTTVPAAIGGAVFTPGVYHTATNIIDWAGNPTFDALGDSTAVFIFYVTGNIIINAGAGIVLAGGANWSNIFFVSSAGALNIGAGATVKGNFIVHTDVTAAAGVDIQGRVFTETGLVTLNNPTFYNV